MIDAEQLREMSRIDIAKVDRGALVDLRTIQIDADAPAGARLRQLVRQVGNPYAFRVGDVAVKLEYNPMGRPLRDLLIQYLSSLKEST